MVNEEEVGAKKISPMAKPAKDLLELPLNDSGLNQKVQIGSLLKPI